MSCATRPYIKLQSSCTAAKLVDEEALPTYIARFVSGLRYRYSRCRPACWGAMKGAVADKSLTAHMQLSGRAIVFQVSLVIREQGTARACIL